MKISSTEGDGIRIPALTTVMNCGKDSVFQPFLNAQGYDYYVYQIYNTGNCKIKFDLEELTPAGAITRKSSKLINLNEQLTLAFDAPAAGNKTRFTAHCLEGIPPNNCSFNFKFYGGKKTKEKEREKTKEFVKGAEIDRSIPPINTGNCKTDSITLWTVQNETSDATLQVEGYFKSKGNCPAICTIVSGDKAYDKKAIEMPSKNKIAAFTSISLKKGSSIAFKGFCKEFAMASDCAIGIDSIRFK